MAEEPAPAGPEYGLVDGYAELKRQWSALLLTDLDVVIQSF
jgi:hypothetical protein